MFKNDRLLFSLLIICLSFSFTQPKAEIINDFSRLNPVQVAKVIRVTTVQDVVTAVNSAHLDNLKVSISNKRNSQGGHIATRNGIVLDMQGYNKIVRLDKQARTIRVQSGTTWGEVQQFINEHDLALKVSQSSNIFSVGGSLGSNIHGRDPRFGTIAETINSFGIVLSDGRHLEVSRTQNSELFHSAIGGYGLLGVITEVEIFLTENHWLRKSVRELSYTEYVQHLEREPGDELALHYGRCSIVRDTGFFRDCIAVDFLQLDTLASGIKTRILIISAPH